MLLVHLQMNFLILSLIASIQIFWVLKKSLFKIVIHMIVKHNTGEVRLFTFLLPNLITFT